MTTEEDSLRRRFESARESEHDYKPLQFAYVLVEELPEDRCSRCRWVHVDDCPVHLGERGLWVKVGRSKHPFVRVHEINKSLTLDKEPGPRGPMSPEGVCSMRLWFATPGSARTELALRNILKDFHEGDEQAGEFAHLPGDPLGVFDELYETCVGTLGMLNVADEVTYLDLHDAWNLKVSSQVFGTQGAHIPPRPQRNPLITEALLQLKGGG